MAVQLTGLAGFDSGTVVSQLVALAQKPLTDIDTKKSLVDSAGVTLNNFSTKLAALKTASVALSTTSGFTSMGITSSDTSIVSTVAGSPPPGSYSVSVSQLARAQKSRSDAQVSATTALNQAGTLTLQIGSQTAVNVTVAATDTLSDVATKINQAGVRLSANVINAGGSYRLAIQGLDSGAANSFTIAEGGSVSFGFANPASRIETAQDANLTIDGLAVTRPTNQITGALPGVTLALTKVTTAPATLTVAGDSSQLKTKINALVTAYNDVVNSGHQATGYGTSKATNSVLAADPAVRRSLDRVSRLFAGEVAGASSNYRSMASIGLSLSREGTLTFDTTKFEAAVTKDPGAVQKLFVTDTTLGATGLMKNIEDAVTGLITTDNGPIKARIAALSAQSKALTASRAQKQVRVDAYEKQLKKQFSDLDIAMSRYQSMSTTLNSIG